MFGAEVNAASKLGEDTAKAWEIPVTDTDNVKNHAESIPGISFEKIDEKIPGTDVPRKIIYNI